MSAGRPIRRYVAVLAAAAILAALPLAAGGNSFYMRVLTGMLIFITYTVAFNLIFGHTRQLFLCLGALAGSSAYVAVIAVKQLGVPAVAAIALGALAAGLIGGVLSYVSVRRGLGLMFVGILTLAFSLTFENLIQGLRDLTHGETGLVTTGLGLDLLQDRTWGYYAFLALVLLSLLGYEVLVGSRVGIAFRALSEDELSAELAGVDVARYKVVAAFAGSTLIGLAGAAYAFYNGFISPTIFSITSIDIVVLVMLLFGGMATTLGPVVGGVVFTVVNELVRPLGPLNVLVYGALLIALFVFRDDTIAFARRALARTSGERAALTEGKSRG